MIAESFSCSIVRSINRWFSYEQYLAVGKSVTIKKLNLKIIFYGKMSILNLERVMCGKCRLFHLID